MSPSARPGKQHRFITYLVAGAVAIASIVAVGPIANASPDTGRATTLIAPAAPKKEPAKSNLKYSLAAKIYTGKAQSVAVTSKVSGMGKITVYYTGASGTKYAKSKTAPKTVGTYAVSVKIAAGQTYRAATLKLGTMKIVSTWTITFNANGGKIGSAKTKSVSATNKAKIGTLPVAKRPGYSFQGWYTAKSGGSKISASTKATKNATYYAHWTNPSALDKKLVGHWSWTSLSGVSSYDFRPDGTYTSLVMFSLGGTYTDTCIFTKGSWKAASGVLTLSNRQYQSAKSLYCATQNVATIQWGPWTTPSDPTSKHYYETGTDGSGKYAIIESEPLQSGGDYFKYRLDS